MNAFWKVNVVKNEIFINIYGTYEEPLFKAKDIGDLLGIKNIRDTLINLDDQCKIKLNVGSTDVGNFSDTWFLTEDGYTKYYLYHENYLNTIIHILYEQRKYK